MNADIDLNGFDLINVGSLFLDGDIVEADVIAEYIDFNETSVPANPSTNTVRFYAKDSSGDSRLFYKDSTGTEIPVGLADDSVTDAMLAEVATSTIKGRATAGTGNPENLTGAQVRSVIGLSSTDSPTFANITQTGYLDQAEIAEPASPSTNTSRIYTKDINGITSLLYKDTTGRERLLDRGIYDIREFGALVDGSTDDSAAIQAAIDAAELAGGGTVFFPSGTAVIGSTIIVGSNMTLAGVGWSSVLLLADAADVDMIRNENFSNIGTGDTNITIRDLKIDGNRANQTAGADVHGIAFDADETERNTYVNLLNLWVTSCEGHGIHPKGTNYLTVQNVVSESNGVSGDILFHNFYLLRNDHIDIRGLKTANCVSGRGAKLTRCQYGYAQIESNNDADDGIVISGDSHFLHCDFVSYSSGDSGVQVVSEDALEPTRNTLSVTVDGAGNHGLNLGGSQNSVVGGVTQNCTNTGVNISGSKNTVVGIRSRDNDIGIEVQSTGDANTIVGNQVENNTTSDLVDGGTNTIKAGNQKAIGYSSGDGGTVTQATSKSTGVTLNTYAGEITMNNATLNANTTVSFVVSNTEATGRDVVIVNHVSGGTQGAYAINADAADNSITMYVRNITGGNLGEAIVLRFAIVRGSNN